MIVYPDNKNLKYSGRIDFSDEKNPIFVFPCTYVKMKFIGNTLKVHLENKREYWDNYIGYIIDGKQDKAKLKEFGQDTINIEVLPENKEHEIIIFKRQDSCHEICFKGFEIEDNAQILPILDNTKRKIEFYGDSVSAGEVSEAVDYVGKTDPEHNGEYSNSWYSYAWLTARKLNADIHDIAQGGIALLNNTGWFHAPNYIGMEDAWDKIRYNPTFGKITKWDFSKYTPQVVVIAIGQNDNNPFDYMKDNYNGEKSKYWREKYEAFVRNIRATYPNAWIILTTTILCHDPSWDKSIDEVCQKINDNKIKHFLYSRNGVGTPGHIRISEAEEMSNELAAYINTLDIEDWD